MDGKYLFILLIKQTLAIVYYSNTRQGYNDSVLFCTKRGGELLRYGQVFLAGIRDCENSTETVNVWTGYPHYDLLGCTENMGDKMSELIDKIDSSKCSDFCELEQYSHVGISDEKCTCYLGKPNIDCNKDYKCPGNPLDTCGKDDKYIVYAKVYNTTCRSRYYRNIQQNGDAIKLNEQACGYYTGTSLCKVGNSIGINCDIDSITTTVQGELPQSTLEPTTSVTSEGNISSGFTETSSFDFVTTKEQNPQTETWNIGLIIGVVVAVAVLLTIMIIIIYRRVRTKSSDCYVAKHGKVAAYQNNTSQKSDKDDTSVNREGNKQSLMYDFASIGNNTTSNDDLDNTFFSTTNGVYDSAVQNNQEKIEKRKLNGTEQEYGCVTKSEGVYDSAVQNQSETKQMTRKDDLHIYDYRGTTEGLYDSASNQQVVHTEENEYGCTVKPEGLYDVSGTQSQMKSSLPVDNIYDHNSDILYDVSKYKSGTGVTDIYDHT